MVGPALTNLYPIIDLLLRGSRRSVCLNYDKLKSVSTLTMVAPKNLCL